MNAKATATLDGTTAVEVLHTQTEVTNSGTITRYFIRFPKGGTGWVDASRVTDIADVEGGRR